MVCDGRLEFNLLQKDDIYNNAARLKRRKIRLRDQHVQLILIRQASPHRQVLRRHTVAVGDIALSRMILIFSSSGQDRRPVEPSRTEDQAERHSSLRLTNGFGLLEHV